MKISINAKTPLSFEIEAEHEGRSVKAKVIKLSGGWWYVREGDDPLRLADRKAQWLAAMWRGLEMVAADVGYGEGGW